MAMPAVANSGAFQRKRQPLAVTIDYVLPAAQALRLVPAQSNSSSWDASPKQRSKHDQNRTDLRANNLRGDRWYKPGAHYRLLR
jgi:hypothetical protein